MPQTKIMAALNRSLGANYATVVVKALAQDKKSERRFSRVLRACHETSSMLQALKKEFGDDLLSALSLAIDGENLAYSRHRGISAYIRIHDGASSGSQVAALAELRDEFTVNVERLLACRYTHQETVRQPFVIEPIMSPSTWYTHQETVRQQFEAAFRIWESRYLALMGPFPEDVDALDAIQTKLRRGLPDNMGASSLGRLVDWLANLLKVILMTLLLIFMLFYALGQLGDH